MSQLTGNQIRKKMKLYGISFAMIREEVADLTGENVTILTIWFTICGIIANSAVTRTIDHLFGYPKLNDVNS